MESTQKIKQTKKNHRSTDLPDDLVAKVESDVKKFVSSMVQNPADAVELLMEDTLLSSFLKIEEPFKPTKTDIKKYKLSEQTLAQLEAVRDTAVSNANHKFNDTKAKAQAARKSANSALNHAQEKYDNDRKHSMADLQSAAKIAQEKYEEASSDSPTRTQMLYAELRVSLAEGISTFENTVKKSASELAKAAGVWMTAQIDYWSAVSIAQAERLKEVATAEQAFWAGVEQAIDAPTK